MTRYSLRMAHRPCFPYINDKISDRLAGFSLKMPRRALVTMMLPGFLAPRIVMQVCVASMMHAAPMGFSSSISASAIWRGQPLLDLRPPRVALDEPRELAQADHFPIGQIRHDGPGP